MASEYFIFLLCCLAVFRGSEFVALDDGPWFVMKKLRGSCKGHPAWCELLTCFYCCSAYISIAAVALLLWMGVIGLRHIPLWWGGIWGGAAFIFRIVRERK